MPDDPLARLRATTAAARQWAARPLHGELEQALAGFCGAQKALVFSSGYLENLAVITALVAAPGAASTLVVSDAANHASLVDAC